MFQHLDDYRFLPGLVWKILGFLLVKKPIVGCWQHWCVAKLRDGADVEKLKCIFNSGTRCKNVELF